MGVEPRLVALPESLVRHLDPLDGAAGLVLAVSGGPDSTALMHLAAAWRQEGQRPPIVVASVDHGLRLEAAGEADAVVARAQALGLAAQRLVWTEEKPVRGLPTRARAARYGLLAGYARQIGASHIVTAHTLDDQAETVLMRLVRGSGLSGLGAIRQMTLLDGLTLARPLLGIVKADLVRLCAVNGWPVVEDPTNADLAYARPRWRYAAPMLEAEGLTADRLGRLAGRLARADDALEAVASVAFATVFRKLDRCVDLTLLAPMPEEIILRVIRRALAEARPAADPRLDRLETVCADLAASHRVGKPLVRTLAGCLLSLDKHGILAIAAEPRRKRGVTRSLQHYGEFTGGRGLCVSPSLGKGTPASYIGSVDAPAREPDVVESHSASDAPHRGPMLSAGPQ